MQELQQKPPAPRPVDAILEEVRATAAASGLAATAVILEDFRPLAESLESRLSDRYWERRGMSPFREEAVPYAVNACGWAAEAAAELLLASAEAWPDRARGGPWHVLELGAGSGLFARQLLDALRRLCGERGSALYGQLVYHVTDGSPATLAHWRELGIFDDHAGRVELARCDATSSDDLARAASGAPLSALFLNYLLDSLPTSIVRRGATGPEQLHARTTWRPAPGEDFAAELAACAGGGPEQLDRILSFSHRLELELEFRPGGAAELPYVDELLEGTPEGARAVLNHAALRCLEACMERLAPGGFVLVNDYGPARAEEAPRMASVQRFGDSTCVGLHFPFLERFLRARGHAVASVPGDDERRIHTRLVAAGDEARTRSAFERLFGDARYLRADDVAREALEYVAGARFEDALDCLREGLRAHPRDWQLLGQAAELCSRLQRHEQALALAQAALAVNPWTSAYLWNTRGNALFGVGRVADAHESYLHARAIHAGEPQTELNLAFSHAAFGAYEEALACIARGLAGDRTGYFRSALLEKQQQLLTALASRWNEQELRSRRRKGAFEREA